MRDGAGHDLGRADGEVLGPDVDGDELAAELFHVDREHGWLHGGVQRVLQRALGLRRAVHGQARTGVVQRAEERDAQNVVEVEVGEERRGVHRRPERPHLPLEDVTQRTQAGAQVHDKGLVPLDVDHEARGVAPVAAVAIPRARARPPYPVERDVHPHDVTLRRSSTFCTHGATDHQSERAGLRLPDRRARRRAARPVPTRVPRHRAHLALPPARTGGRRLPRRGAVPARLRPDRDSRRRPLPGGRPGAGRQRAARCAGRRRGRRHRRPRLGRPGHVRRGGAPTRPLAPCRDGGGAPHGIHRHVALHLRPAAEELVHVLLPVPAGRGGAPARRLLLHRPPLARLVTGLRRHVGRGPGQGVHRRPRAHRGRHRLLPGPVRPELQVPELADEQAAALLPTPKPTLYLHGRDDDCMLLSLHRRAARLPGRGLRDGDRRRRRPLPPRGAARRGQPPHRRAS